MKEIRIPDELLARLQTAAAWVAVGGLLLGFLASIDLLLLPRGAPGLAWAIHPVLLLLGAAGGVATNLRGRQLDRRRWEILAEPLLTDMERETAHHDAERERRWASIWFLAAPLALGYWAAYQLTPTGEARVVTYALPVTALLAFAAGLLLANRWLGPEEPPPF